MGQTTRKLNFMIDKDVADELEKYVPAGRRSKVVTRAIARELALQRRKRILDRMLALRATTPKINGEKLISELAEDRKRR